MSSYVEWYKDLPPEVFGEKPKAQEQPAPMPGMAMPPIGGMAPPAGAMPPAGSGASGVTSFGPNGKNEPNKPIGMMQTAKGPQLIHEGEPWKQNPDGTTTITSQKDLQKLQKKGMKGYAEGGTAPTYMAAPVYKEPTAAPGTAEYMAQSQTANTEFAAAGTAYKDYLRGGGSTTAPAAAAPSTAAPLPNLSAIPGTPVVQPAIGAAKLATQQSQMNIAAPKSGYASLEETGLKTLQGMANGTSAQQKNIENTALTQQAGANAAAAAGSRQIGAMSGLSKEAVASLGAVQARDASGEQSKLLGDLAGQKQGMAKDVASEAIRVGREGMDREVKAKDSEWARILEYNDPSTPEGLAFIQQEYVRLYGGQAPDMQAIIDDRTYSKTMKDNQIKDAEWARLLELNDPSTPAGLKTLQDAYVGLYGGTPPDLQQIIDQNNFNRTQNQTKLKDDEWNNILSTYDPTVDSELLFMRREYQRIYGKQAPTLSELVDEKNAEKAGRKVTVEAANKEYNDSLWNSALANADPTDPNGLAYLQSQYMAIYGTTQAPDMSKLIADRNNYLASTNASIAAAEQKLKDDEWNRILLGADVTDVAGEDALRAEYFRIYGRTIDLSGIVDDQKAAKARNAQTIADAEKKRTDDIWQRTLLYNDPTTDAGLKVLQDTYRSLFGGDAPDFQALTDERTNLKAQNSATTQGILRTQKDADWQRALTNWDPTTPDGLDFLRNEYTRLYGGTPPDLNTLVNDANYAKTKKANDLTKESLGLELADLGITAASIQNEAARIGVDASVMQNVAWAINQGYTREMVNSTYHTNINETQWGSLSTKYNISVKMDTIGVDAATIANLSATLGLTSQKTQSIVYAVNQGMSREAINNTYGTNLSESEYMGLARQYNIAILSGDLAVDLAKIGITKANTDAAAADFGLKSDIAQQVVWAVNQGMSLGEINGTYGTKLSLSDYNDLKVRYDQSITAGNLKIEADRLGITSSKMNSIITDINAGITDAKVLNGMYGTNYTQAQVDGWAAKYMTSLKALNLGLTDSQMTSAINQINAGVLDATTISRNTGLVLTQPQVDSIAAKYKKSLVIEDLNIANLQTTLSATQYQTVSDKVNSGATWDQVSKDLMATGLTGAQAMAAYNSMGIIYAQKVSSGAIGLDTLRNGLGDQKFGSIIARLNAGATPEMIKREFPDTNFTQSQLAAMVASTPTQIARYEFDKQFGLQDRTLKITEQGAESDAYWDGSKRFSSYVTSHVDAMDANGHVSADARFEAQQWYKDKYGKDYTTISPSQFDDWMKGEIAAANDKRLTNPIDASIYQISSSSLSDSEKANAIAQIKAGLTDGASLVPMKNADGTTTTVMAKLATTEYMTGAKPYQDLIGKQYDPSLGAQYQDIAQRASPWTPSTSGGFYTNAPKVGEYVVADGKLVYVTSSGNTPNTTIVEGIDMATGQKVKSQSVAEKENFVSSALGSASNILPTNLAITAGKAIWDWLT